MPFTSLLWDYLIAGKTRIAEQGRSASMERGRAKQPSRSDWIAMSFAKSLRPKRFATASSSCQTGAERPG